ncbi:hypothetical protein M8C21_031805, partial [Ambrosia artemisiifolia]
EQYQRSNSFHTQSCTALGQSLYHQQLTVDVDGGGFVIKEVSISGGGVIGFNCQLRRRRNGWCSRSALDQLQLTVNHKHFGE